MALALGTHPLGSQPLGWGPLHDPPVVSYVGPTGTISVGGPEVEFSWTYSQPQNDPQDFYQIRILNDAEDTELYSTGFVPASGQTQTIDWDEAGLPTGVTVKVELSVIGGGWTAVEALQSVYVDWGSPSITTLVPANGTVHSDPNEITVGWLFSDSPGKVQDQYRVRLLGPDTGVELYSTGWLSGTANTFDVPYSFVNNTTVRIEVSVRNQHGLTAVRSDSVVQVDLPDVADFGTNPDVGKIYEVAINGVGYMLDDKPENPGWQSGAIPLVPDRLATSETPFAESVNRYTFYGTSEFVGGAGEEFGNRSDSDPKRFAGGEAIDIFEDNRLETGRAGVQVLTGSWADTRMVSGYSKLWVQTAQDQLSYSVNEGSTWAPFTLTEPGAASIEDMDTDGTYLYVATLNGIARVSAGTNPATLWSTAGQRRVRFAAGRIVSTKNTGKTLITIGTGTGTEEYSLLAFSEGRIELGGVAGGFFYFVHVGGPDGNTSTLYAWQLGLNDSGNPYTPFEVWRLPDGARFVNVEALAQSVWLALEEADGDRVVLYRCVPTDNGSVQSFRVADTEAIDAVGDHHCPMIEHEGKVLVGWPDARVLAVGLADGGYVDWTGEVQSGVKMVDLASARGQLFASTSGGEVFKVEDRAETGWVTTPIFDAGSTLDKVFDDVTIACEPLSAGESITVQYSVDQGASFQPLGTLTTAGATRYTMPLGVQAQSIQLKAILNGTPTTSPTLTYLGVRLHPLGLVDGLRRFAIKLSDFQEGLNGSRLPDSRKGRAAEQRRALEDLAGQRVLVQDIDWPLLGLVETMEILEVETSVVKIHNPKSGLQFRCLVTLRKSRTQ